MAPRPVSILLISGSLRAGSTNSSLLRTAGSLAPEGVVTTLYDALGDLPHFNPDDDVEGQPLPPEPAKLRRLLDEADAVLFCTPEYAGTLPGSLKNAIDWLVGSGELYRKPVAWTNVAAPGRGTGAEATLSLVLGYVDADIIEPACLRIPIARNAIDADGTVADPDIRSRLAAQLTAVAGHVRPTPSSARA
jgi:NAD(P)H-dependent FMN reductase